MGFDKATTDAVLNDAGTEAGAQLAKGKCPKDAEVTNGLGRFRFISFNFGTRTFAGM